LLFLLQRSRTVKVHFAHTERTCWHSGDTCTIKSRSSFYATEPNIFNQKQLSCAFRSLVRRRIERMSSFRDGVRCTVHNRSMLIHLDNGSVEIPSKLVNSSKVLMDALSVSNPSDKRKVTLAVPKEWLQAWAACYCNEEESLRSQNIEDLIHCLLVCLLIWNAPCIVPPSSDPAVAASTAP
jgi:hypothetical protein